MAEITNLEQSKLDLIAEIEKRVNDKIIEKSNADLLIKLINNAESLTEAIAIAELGTTYKRTGLHFDKRLEKFGNAIKYFYKNNNLSFKTDVNAITHKLIIGDNYDALLNLLVSYRGKIDVIYIDPPYGKDSMGEFANTNYDNSLTRDNLLSMLYPRIQLAKQLLTPDGVLICSIDDKNQAYVKCLFDEVFGEAHFIFCAPRQTKKGGKTTTTIQKNHDYLICYSMSDNPVFCQDERDVSSFNLTDEYVEVRGPYKTTQTLDYNSLSYSASLDYEIELEGRIFVPGGDYEAYKARKAGNYQAYDWTWRWSEDAFKWGVENGFIVLKGDRIYTKTYAKCRKKPNACEIEFVDGKSFTTMEFMENEYSNDNGKKKLKEVFDDGDRLFDNPKPPMLVSKLISMVCDNDNAIILDFFAGSGTTGQAVLELNREDGGNRKFVLCTNNEKTDKTPNGIAYDVTSKRLKRIMTGKCYDNSSNFDWIKKNEPYGDNLDVYEVKEVANFENTEGKTPFDVINETLYGKEKFNQIKDKIDWVCSNFEGTQRIIESDEQWKKRVGDK